MLALEHPCNERKHSLQIMYKMLQKMEASQTMLLLMGLLFLFKANRGGTKLLIQYPHSKG